jgi:hypothetical protein
MLIPLGFLAASGVSAGSFDLLETQVLTSSQASVTFSSLSTYASTYQHLQLRIVARSTKADTYDYLIFKLNNTTQTNGHSLIGQGSSVLGWNATNPGIFTAGNSAAGAFGATVLDLLDPFETTKNKTWRAFNGQPAYPWVSLNSGFLNSTAATSSIVLSLESGSFAQYSRFSLYGIKAA